jgi:hypothetical protein
MFWRKTIYMVLFVLLMVLLISIGLYTGWTIMNDKTTQVSWLHFLFIELPRDVIANTLNQRLDSNTVLILVPIILLSITFSFISIFSLSVFVVLSLGKNKSRTHIVDTLNVDYRELIIDYLFNDSQKALDELKAAKKDLAKKIIIGQIINLKKNIIGDSADRLRTLFIELGYDRYVTRKLNSLFWHVKVENIRILSIMYIGGVSSRIAKFLNSENSVLRMEAQLALINLNRENPYQFLETLEYPLTEWDQINIYDTTVRNSLSLPDFAGFLGTQNKSVTIFSLKMIGAFKQKVAYGQVKNLVNNPNQKISRQAIQTLGELGNTDVIALFRELFPLQNLENKVAMIRSMSKIKGDEAITFLKEKLYDDEFDIQMESSKALYNMQLENQEHLEKVVSETNNENLITIFKHLTDRRIK